MKNVAHPGTPAHRRKGLIRRFGKNQRGVAAVEFAMLAFPFLLLTFATIETCISFAASQMLQNSVDRVARELRTQQILPADITADEIHSRVCNGIRFLVVDDTCPELFVDLKRYDKIADIPDGVTRTASGDVDLTGFTVQAPAPLDIAQLRAFYRWPIMADIMKGRLDNMNRSSKQGKLLLFATMTWRNESSS